MQQLYQLIKQRFDKVNTLTHNTSSLNLNDNYRQLREQQKIRCQKQAWILSMLRAKKTNMNTAAKNTYFKYSYQIMKIIDHSFVYQIQPNLSDQNFLNDFVCLYTKFFDNYQDKFQFKVKIKNLLRPTNHNILNDMVKYLADFSRDYSQHIYIWQIKSIKKQQQQLQQNQRKLSISNASNQSVIYSSASTQNSTAINGLQNKPLQSFRNSVNIGYQPSLRRYNQQSQTQITIKKNQFNKIYGILELQPLPNSIFVDKNKINVDVLKLRMNQLYRDAKYRNNFIKNQIGLYYNSYHSKFNPNNLNNHLNNNKQNLIQDANPHISHPYRVSLVIQKNGFSCINISTYQKGMREQRNPSPIKDKLRLSSLSNKQSGLNSLGSTKSNKNDFVLNSLKVLRVSQNFLPPLHARKQRSRVNSEQQSKKQSQPASTKFSNSNTQNLMNLQLQGARQDQINNNGVIYYNQQLLRQAQRRKNQKRRLTQMRKHFTSQQQKTKSKKSDPQQKIVQWLDKINIMKQLQRKKILGLS